MLPLRSRLSADLCLAILAIATLAFGHSVLADDHGSFLTRFDTANLISSTIPANGDVNPYGIVVVPRSMGLLKRGHILISNFNNGMNQQGTGTTIVQVSPEGTLTVFAQIDPSTVTGCPGGVGLTTALTVLRRGWVIVGSLPTTNRARQRQPRGRNLPGRRHQWTLGHDQCRRGGSRLAVCHQRT
jgi:hypothetical protein